MLMRVWVLMLLRNRLQHLLLLMLWRRWWRRRSVIHLRIRRGIPLWRRHRGQVHRLGLGHPRLPCACLGARDVLP